MLQELQDELAYAKSLLAGSRYQDQIDWYNYVITEIQEEIAEIID